MINCTHTFFRIALPYCFQKMTKPGHVWLPLNRNYKPLNWTGRKRIDYEAHLDTALAFARDPATFPDIWWNASGDTCWLYDGDGFANDGERAEYFIRLQRLLAHKHSYFDAKAVAA
jgi:hypothetical protein